MNFSFDMAAIASTQKSSQCKKCLDVIAVGVDYIECEGLCNGLFHAACMKLSHDVLMQHRSTISNFYWLCNQCIKTIRKQRSERPKLMPDQQDKNATLPKANDVSRIDGEIAKLKQEIVSLHHSLNSITPRVEANKTENLNAHRPLAESSLLCLSDSQQSTTHSGRHSRAAVEQRAPNDRFWLFFTRVKNCVTEQQILEFVTDSLGTDDAVVKKLVPAWKDTLSMPYVSFKVGVDVRLKEIALQPSTWPAGLRYREFRDDVWEPL